jgi:hypothetical protein
LLGKRLLKKTLESKGRMKEKAEKKNCIFRSFVICIVSQRILPLRAGHGARILNKGWNFMLYSILVFALAKKK